MENSTKIFLWGIIFFSISLIITFLLYWNFTTGDAFTHMAYAKDLIIGKGYSFAGNRVYGSTSPLWSTILIAISSKITGLELESVAKILSFIFSILSFIIFYRLISERFTQYISILALFLFSFNAYLMRWIFCGMETTAAVFYTIFFIYVFSREDYQKLNRLIFIIIGFSTLIRPEFYLFITIFFFHKIFILRKRKWWSYAVISFIPSLIWNLFAYSYFGSIIPSSFKAKVGDLSIISINQKIIIRNIVLFLSGNFIEFLLMTSIFVFFIIKRNRPNWKAFIYSEYFPIFFSVFSFYLLYLIKGILLISRYTSPLIPFIIIFSLFLFEKVVNEISFINNNTKKIVFFILIPISILFNGLFSFFVIKPDSDSFVSGFQKQYKKMVEILS